MTGELIDLASFDEYVVGGAVFYCHCGTWVQAYVLDFGGDLVKLKFHVDAIGGFVEEWVDMSAVRVVAPDGF